MSDTGVFKSVKDVAQEHSMEIEAAAEFATYSISGSTFNGKTNLKVIKQLIDASSQIVFCNTAFKGLVNDDADSIKGLAETFDEFDTNLASYMEG